MPFAKSMPLENLRWRMHYVLRPSLGCQCWSKISYRQAQRKFDRQTVRLCAGMRFMYETCVKCIRLVWGLFNGRSAAWLMLKRTPLESAYSDHVRPLLKQTSVGSLSKTRQQTAFSTGQISHPSLMWWSWSLSLSFSLVRWIFSMGFRDFRSKCVLSNSHILNLLNYKSMKSQWNFGI